MGLGDAFLATISDPDPQDAIADLADAGIDDLLLGDEGVLGKVPGIAVLVKLVRAFGRISDWTFAKKVLQFHLGVGSATARHRFAGELAADKKKAREVGEQLILLLERLDDIPKAKYLGRLFRAQIEGELTADDFRLMAAALDRLVTPHLRAVFAWYSSTPPEPTDEQSQAFAFAGIAVLDIYSVPGGIMPVTPRSRLALKRNDLGRKMVEILTRP
jgi:hypothetical protein